MAEQNREHLKKQLLLWDLMSKEDRDATGEPASLRGWAEAHGVSARTATYWRAEEEYQVEKDRLLAQRAARAQHGLPDTLTRTVGLVAPEQPPVPEVDPSTPNSDLFATIIRQQLVLAQAGDKTALDFVRSPAVSKPLLEALSAETDASDFPDKSDDELVDMVLDAFPDLVVERLRARGMV